MKSEDQKIYLSSFQIRKKLDLPINISSLLNVFQVSINDHKGQYNSFFAVTNQDLFGINIQLQKAFLKFSKAEKIYSYTFCVEFLRAVIQNNLIQQGLMYKKYTFEKKEMEFRAYQRPGMLSLWEKILLVVNFQDTTITLVSKGEEKFDLRQYYMRESKDPSKFCLIFECITPIAPKSNVRIGFDSKNFNEVKIKLRRLMEEIEKEKLFTQLKNNASKAPKRANSVKSQFSYLNNNVINNFKAFAQQVRERPQITLTKTQVYRSSSKIISMLQGVYFLEEVFLMRKENLMQSLRVCQSIWNSLVKECVSIEKREGGKLQALYYKFQFEDKVYQCTVATEQRNAQDQGLFLFQTLEPTESKQVFRFDYMILRVIKVTEEISRMTIETRMSTGNADSQQFMLEYLMEFSNLVQALKTKSEKFISQTPKGSFASNIEVNIDHQQSQQETIYIDAMSNMEDLDSVEDSQDQVLSNEQPIIGYRTQSKSESTRVDQNQTIPSPSSQNKMQNVLSFKHFWSPLQKDQPKRMTTHYLDVQWKRNKNGVLVCTNQRILNEQKKVCKHILTTFGRNILRHKSFLSISLPVSICTKKSHLQIIASNFSYVPLLLEPYCNASPLERMKKLIIFNITVGSTGVGSEKPFNPILGETYQGMFNGCSISLEQISHHPAISAYYFEGRGFRVVGAIEPRIELCGINSGRGYSDRQNRVQFDDGSICYTNYPKMYARGFLFGQRQFMFESKNFVFDDKNLVFAEIHYGPKKTSFFGGTQDPYDLIYGKIYKVKPSFLDYFKSQKNKAFPEKEHIVAELATFEGTWTQSIKIDGVQAYNFRTQLPIIMQDYPASLPSNSTFRTDLVKLIEGNIPIAQEQKQRCEEIQRRDRNLRDKGKERRNKQK